MALSIEKLCEVLNSEFGSPFLVDGGVVAEILENEDGSKELSINIGRRDVQIDADGEVTSSGTFIAMADNTLIFNEEGVL